MNFFPLTLHVNLQWLNEVSELDSRVHLLSEKGLRVLSLLAFISYGVLLLLQKALFVQEGELFIRSSVGVRVR